MAPGLLERSTRVPPVTSPRIPNPRERLIRLRLMMVGLFISLWATGTVVRLFQLQVLGRASFLRQAARQSERTITVDPRRGAILDRSGKPLAVSVDADSIYAVPQDVSDARTTEYHAITAGVSFFF